MPAAKTLKRYGLITVACALYALGFNWFFVPNHFTVGGFTGVAQIINHFLPMLPVGTIDEDTAAEVIPEKDSTVLVYCRSGNRSKTASSTLAELGYTNIYEFGGINTWPYETEP